MGERNFRANSDLTRDLVPLEQDGAREVTPQQWFLGEPGVHASSEPLSSPGTKELDYCRNPCAETAVTNIPHSGILKPCKPLDW